MLPPGFPFPQLRQCCDLLERFVQFRKLPRLLFAIAISTLSGFGADSVRLEIEAGPGRAEIKLNTGIAADFLLESASVLPANVWTPEALMIVTNPTAQFIATSRTQSQQFYRAFELRRRAPAVQLEAFASSNLVMAGCKVDGDLSNVDLRLRVRPVQRPSEAWQYLDQNGTWQSSSLLVSPAASTNFSFTLPPNRTGEWLVQALLTANGSTNIVAAAERSVLVSMRPAISLEVNRQIANSSDPVKAELTLAAGATDRAVKVAAYLVTPGGAELNLPSLAADRSFLYEGPATSSTFSLFHRPMFRFGAGRYDIRARLVDASSGELLGLASGTFEVCDQGTDVQGVIQESGGEAWAGAGGSLAMVAALDLDDKSVAATASIQSDGSYLLRLVPGRYLLSTVVITSDGFYEAAHTNVVQIGCSNALIQISLKAPVRPAEITKTKSVRALNALNSPPATPNASDGLPKPGVLIYTTMTGLNAEERAQAAIFSRQFTGWLRTAAGTDVEIISQQEVAQVFDAVAGELLSGDDPNLDNLTQVSGKEFLILLNFRSSSAGKAVIAMVFDTKENANIRAHEERGPALNGGMALETASRTGIGLFSLLRSHQDRPLLPELDLQVNPENARLGSSLNIRAELREGNGTAAPGEAVSISVQGPSMGDTISATTDAQGNYDFTYPAGTTVGRGSVTARFERNGGIPMQETRFFRVIDFSNLHLTSPHGGLRSGDVEQVCVNLHFGDAPVAGAVIALEAAGGTLGTSSVSTDASGRACFNFTAGPQSGVANIIARYEPEGQAQQTAQLPFIIVGAASTELVASSTTVVGSGTTDVIAEVRVGGARMAALPVEFILEGAGALSVVSNETDENGQAAVTFRAPDIGSGSSVITTITRVEEEFYTNSITINYQPVSGCGLTNISSYTVTRLTLGSGGDYFEWGTAINRHGEVVGHTSLGQAGRAFHYSGGTIRDLSSVGVSWGGAEDVNDNGDIVGFRSAGALEAVRAFLYRTNTMITLPTLGGTAGLAYGINAAGDVVGQASVTGNTASRAFLYRDGVMLDLGTLGGRDSASHDINKHGAIVGWSQTVEKKYHAFLYQNGSMRDLGKFATWNSRANAINDHGDVVGESHITEAQTRPFLYRDGIMINLGTLGGTSAAMDINNSGHIVGYSEISQEQPRAFIYANGQMQNLNGLIPANSGWELLWANAINDCGLIVGGGRVNGVYSAFLLTPVQP